MSIHPDIQRKAAEAVARLAERTAARAVADGDLPQDEGWAMSCGLMPRPIHVDRMREAEQLYAQADALCPDGFWMHQRALLLLDLGDFDEAVRSLEACAARGDYLTQAQVQPVIAQCRMLQSGQAREGSEADQQAFAMDWVKQQMMQSLGQHDPGMADQMGQIWDLVEQMGGAAEQGLDTDFDGNDEVQEPRRPPLTEAQSTLACEFAEDFGWALADGHYTKAHAMLGSALQAQLSVDDLRKTYEDMVSYAETPIDRVQALTPYNDLPDMPPDVLASVMVAIDSDDMQEAVDLVISQPEPEGPLCITALEWGRP